MLHVRVVLLFVLALSLGCASSPSTGSRSSAQVITRKEIDESGMTGNAFELVSRLRPNFIVSRGPTSITNAAPGSEYPNVYVDEMPYGDINSLRNIDATQIAEIRRYQAWEAQTKYGPGNTAGVIAIITKR